MSFADSDVETTRQWRDMSLLEKLERLLGLFAAAVLFGMMMITFVDVVGRYLFNAPLTGAYQVVRGAMAVLMFAGLPLVTARREHLTIGLLEAAFKGAARWVQTLLITLISAIVVSFLAWRLFEQGSYYGETGEVLDIIRVPIALFSYYMSVTAAIAAAIMIVMVVQQLRHPPS